MNEIDPDAKLFDKTGFRTVCAAAQVLVGFAEIGNSQ
jgi:hypothetical protein